MSKLSIESIAAIRRSKKTRRLIAELYDVTDTTVYTMLKNNDVRLTAFSIVEAIKNLDEVVFPILIDPL